jgi:hypothetical protein
MTMAMMKVMALFQVFSTRRIGHAVRSVEHANGKGERCGSMPGQRNAKRACSPHRPNRCNGWGIQAQQMPKRQRRPRMRSLLALVDECSRCHP